MHLSAALELVTRGFAIHPLKPGDKLPASAHGCRDATLDVAQVGEWWRRWRNPNAGIATGPASGVWVLDIDGDAGRASLAELEAAHGALPATLTVRTARGYHLYWRTVESRPVRNGAAVRDGIDVRGDGGYVVAPGSLHPTGVTYEWADSAVEPVEAPRWLLDLVAPPVDAAPVQPPPVPARLGGDGQFKDPLQRRVYRDAIERMRTAQAPDTRTGAGGNRNHTLNREAHAMAAAGIPRHLAESALISAALSAGLGDREARATFASGYENGLRAPRARRPGNYGVIRETRFDGLPDRRGDEARARPVAESEVAPEPMPADEWEDARRDAPDAYGERDDPPPLDSRDAAEPRPVLPLSARRRPSPRGWQHQLLRGEESDKIQRTGPNAMMIAAHDDQVNVSLAYDEHARRCVVIAPPAWGEDAPTQVYPRPLLNHDVAGFRVWLQNEWALPIGKEEAVSALEFSARECSFDPVRDYLDALTWDRRPRLKNWLGIAFGATEELSQVFGERWMISAVARAYQPGCKVDSMLVLEGRQGLGKSTALRILGGPFYSDAYIDLSTKDSDLLIQGVWIQELGELAGMGKGELNRIKGWITRQTDRFRAPYASLDEMYPRRAVFAATTNESHYLRDTTGNRRAWPVRCASKLSAEALRLLRDQLWAEAVVGYRQGQAWHLDTPELVRAAEALTSERVEVDPFEEALEPRIDNLNEITSAEAFNILGVPVDRRSKADQMRLGAVLFRLGFTERRQVRREGVKTWVYFRTLPLEKAS